MSQLLHKLIAETATEQDAKRLVDALLSESEIHAVSQRLEVVRLLNEGLPQREIAERLHVGIATVSRGAAGIKRGVFDFLDKDKGAS